MSRLVAAVSLALSLATTADPASAGLATTTSYRVVSASATARLTYTGRATNERSRGHATMQAVLARPTARSSGSLAARGGAVRFRVSVRSSERAEVKERAGPASPYVEQNCADAKRTSASGGLVFTRIPGGRVRVQWAFPDARMRGCPGPTRAARRLRPKMVRVVPGNRFQASRVTLKLSGVARFAEGRYAGVYRWRAVVTLARA